MTRPRSKVPRRASLEGRRNLTPSALSAIDWRELATGAFVVAMVLLGSRASKTLFAEARDIVETQVVFEFPMALLAVCAGQAITKTSRASRAAFVIVGLVAVAAAGAHTAFVAGAPWAMLGGVPLLFARAARPRGSEWWSTEHCRAIEVTAGTAWACLIVGLLLLMLLAAITPSSTPGQTSPAVYAIAWGLYYLSLGLLLPAVRKRFGVTPAKG